jgi:hypothetical protein
MVPFLSDFSVRLPDMSWLEWFDGVWFAQTEESFSFRGNTVVSIDILSHEDWSNTNGISSDGCLSSGSIMDDESKNSVKFVDEAFYVSELLVEMEEDFAVG